MVIFYMILGSLFNAFRGGMFLEHFVGTQVRRVAYVAAFGAASYFAGAFVLQALLAGLFLFLWHLTGWGRAVGAVGGWEDKELKEFWFLDRFADYALPLGKVAWGFVWLTLWGFIAGGVLAVILCKAWLLPAFASMGIVYYTCLRIGLKFNTNGWALSELVYGAICFMALAI